MSERLLNESWTRRSFLRAAGMATLGTTLANGLAFAKSSRPKSFIQIWLRGGPSQLETFDPHPGTRIGGPTLGIPTATPGVQFAQHLPRLAEASGDIAVIRSMVSKEGDHQRGEYHIRTGHRPDPTVKHPSLGSIIAQSIPSQSLDLPPYISILGDSVYSEGGYLGASYQAYRLGNPFDPPRNLQSKVGLDRLNRRVQTLDIIEARHRQRTVIAEAARRTQEETERAVRMMASPQQAAFDIEQESLSVRKRYGLTAFGQGCLVARRLVETGVRAIDVVLSGWDTHTDNFTKHQNLTEKLDSGAAALLADLNERSLLDDTLVVIAGEFGRTPKINPASGRDHWPTGFSVVLAGGGVPGGIVVGATDPQGEKPPEDPVSVPDLSATLLTLLGIDYQREITTPIERPIKLSDGQPIPQLIRT